MCVFRTLISASHKRGYNFPPWEYGYRCMWYGTGSSRKLFNGWASVVILQFSADVVGCNRNPGTGLVEVLDTWNQANARLNQMDPTQNVVMFRSIFSNNRISCTYVCTPYYVQLRVCETSRRSSSMFRLHMCQVLAVFDSCHILQLPAWEIWNTTYAQSWN